MRVLRHEHLGQEGVEGDGRARQKGRRIEEIAVVVQEVVLAHLVVLLLPVPEALDVLGADLAGFEVLALCLVLVLGVGPSFIAGEADHLEDGHVEDELPLDRCVMPRFLYGPRETQVRENRHQVVALEVLVAV